MVAQGQQGFHDRFALWFEKASQTSTFEWRSRAQLSDGRRGGVTGVGGVSGQLRPGAARSER